jgi:hypothetical protein
MSKVSQQFCLAKQTVIDEISGKHQYYNLNFTEWLEFMVRVFNA